MSEPITIQPDAWRAARNAVLRGIFCDRYEPEVRAVITAAAPLIVAAELERWAAKLEAGAADVTAFLDMTEGTLAALIVDKRRLEAHAADMARVARDVRARVAELRATTEGDTRA